MLENIIQETWYIESTKDIEIRIDDNGDGILGTLNSISSDLYSMVTGYTTSVVVGDVVHLQTTNNYPRQIVEIIQDVGVSTTLKLGKKLDTYILAENILRNENINITSTAQLDNNLYEEFTKAEASAIVGGDNLNFYKSDGINNANNFYLYNNDGASMIGGAYDEDNLSNVDKTFTYNKKNLSPTDYINFVVNMEKDRVNGDFGSNVFTVVGLQTNLHVVILNGIEVDSGDYTRLGDDITITNSNILNDFNYLITYSFPNQAGLTTADCRLYYKGYEMSVGFLYDWYRDNLVKLCLMQSVTNTFNPEYHQFKSYGSRKNNNTLMNSQNKMSFTMDLDSAIDDLSVKTDLKYYLENPNNFRIFKIVEGEYVKVYSGCSLEDGDNLTSEKSTNKRSYSINFLDMNVWRFTGVTGNDVNGYEKELVNNL